MMGKQEKTPITIDGVEYAENDLTDEQKVMINHLLDLDRKISSAQFNIDQLNVGRQAFMNMLKSSLEAEPETEE
jgi:hypothetical protein